MTLFQRLSLALSAAILVALCLIWREAAQFREDVNAARRVPCSSEVCRVELTPYTLNTIGESVAKALRSR